MGVMQFAYRRGKAIQLIPAFAANTIAIPVVGPLFHHVSGGLYQRVKWKPGDGLPHIRLDRAADFLIGDRL